MVKDATAIIDIGSNTIRLVLYQYTRQKGLREVINIKTVARLRSHIGSSGEMSEEGIKILETTLKSFKEILDEYEVTHVIAAATAAIRQATNQLEIVTRMKERTGISIEILSEEEEAYFGFLAVVHTMDTSSAVTIDIGGGSTEITLFRDKKLEKSHSFPFGTVSLKQRFVKGDIINEAEKQELITFVQNQFATLPWIHGVGLPIIGIGGSARNVAQIHQQQKDYPISGVHHYEMSDNDLHSLGNRLSALTYEQLVRLDGLSSDRADIIVPAIEVFRTLMDVVGSKRFLFTRQGLREGIIIHAILKKDPNAFSKDDIFDQSARNLAFQYGRAEEEVNYLCRIAEQLYDSCCQLQLFDYSKEDAKRICRAAKLYDLGEYIEINSSNEHTFYLIANQSIDGLTHAERVKLALLTSYKNKDYFRRFSEPFLTWFSNEEIRKLKDFGALLKFVYALNISKRRIVSNITLENIDDKIRANIRLKGNSTAEKYQANKQKKHLERALKHDIQLNFIEE